MVLLIKRCQTVFLRGRLPLSPVAGLTISHSAPVRLSACVPKPISVPRRYRHTHMHTRKRHHMYKQPQSTLQYVVAIMSCLILSRSCAERTSSRSPPVQLCCRSIIILRLRTFCVYCLSSCSKHIETAIVTSAY